MYKDECIFKKCKMCTYTHAHIDSSKIRLCIYSHQRTYPIPKYIEKTALTRSGHSPLRNLPGDVQVHTPRTMASVPQGPTAWFSTMHAPMKVCACVYIYIYIYIVLLVRMWRQSSVRRYIFHIYMCVCVYIYMYIYIYIYGFFFGRTCASVHKTKQEIRQARGLVKRMMFIYVHMHTYVHAAGIICA